MGTDFESRAVSRQAAVEAGAYAGTKITSDTCCAHQAHLRLDLLEKIYESRCMRIGSVGIKLLVLKFVDCVGAILEYLLLDIMQLVAYDHCLKFHSEAVGELASLGKQLKADVGHLAVVVFAIYYEIVGVCHIF